MLIGIKRSTRRNVALTFSDCWCIEDLLLLLLLLLAGREADPPAVQGHLCSMLLTSITLAG
jgi:hypothetical protein